ncbi:MAG: hypothetical protein KDC98_15450, partial [Planctomycetes bacterium]|nr:hypothetical protein [Planctomycetota bacterium]
IARSGEVAKVGANGAPIAGQTEYRVQAQKSTPFAVSAQVRMSAPHQATLIAARSLAVDVPEKGIALPDDAPLAHVVFEVLGAGGEWQVSTAVHAQFGRRAVDVKRELVDAFLERGASEGDAKQAAAALWSSGPCAGLGRDDEVSDADHDALLALLPEPEATDA